MEVIQLCIGGYCVVPNTFSKCFESTRLCALGIDRLSLKECAVLKELSLGLDDIFIARRLGMSEDAIKMLSHVLFSKLGLETRDEARLFSLDHREELQRKRREIMWKSLDEKSTFLHNHITTLENLQQIMEDPS